MISPKEFLNLDAWIAEHCMGWRQGKVSELDDLGVFALRHDTIYIHNRGNSVKEFRPSTDPAAAMMVLEKCLENVEVQIHHEDEGGYSVMCENSFKGPIEAHTDSPKTIPLAICLFAKQLFCK